MVIFSYDETGEFEPKKTNKTSMIAGFIYIGEDEGTIIVKDHQNMETEVELEQARIREFFKCVCDEAGTNIQDLHGSETDDPCRITKTVYEARLPEYIKTGTYNGKNLIYADSRGRLIEDGRQDATLVERKGYYQIIVLYRKLDRVVSDTGSVQQDKFASNRYLSMVEKILSKGVFLNTDVKENENVILWLPTRVYYIRRNDLKHSKDYLAKVEEYRKAGYQVTQGVNNRGEYYKCRVMTPGFIQAASRACQKIKAVNLLKVNTEPIIYDEEHVLAQGFLYLSDCINNCLRDNTYEPDDQKKMVKIRENLAHLNHKKNNLFYVYDRIDDYYDRAMEAAIKKDCFEALSQMYDGLASNHGEVKRYYSKVRFPYVKKQILQTADESCIEQAINRLEIYRISDNLDQAKLLFIYEFLEKLVAASDTGNELRYRLYDLGISAYTHVGNPERAGACYEKCMQLFQYVDSEKEKQTKIRLMVCYCDMFRFEAAEQLGYELLGIDKDKLPGNEKKDNTEVKKGFFTAILNKLFPQDKEQEPVTQTITEQIAEPVSRPLLFRTLGTLGQVLSFERKEWAEDCFKRVLEDRKEIKDPNYYISMSYLLHYYIESGKKEEYEAYASEFFYDASSIEEMFDNLVLKGLMERPQRASFGYGMFILIKAFYRFYCHENDLMLKRFTDIKAAVLKIDNKIDVDQACTGHPWEIIFKYAELLELSLPETERVHKGSNKNAAKRAVDSEKGWLIALINRFGDLEVLSAKIQQDPDNDFHKKTFNRHVNKLWDESMKRKLFDAPETEDPDEQYVALSQLFTYMYH